MHIHCKILLFDMAGPSLEIQVLQDLFYILLSHLVGSGPLVENYYFKVMLIQYIDTSDGWNMIY